MSCPVIDFPAHMSKYTFQKLTVSKNCLSFFNQILKVASLKLRDLPAKHIGGAAAYRYCHLGGKITFSTLF